MQKIEILRNDGGCGTGEVERKGIFNRTEVVELENEVFREVFLGAPDNPTNTNVGETEFVAGCVDGDDTRNFEIPDKFGLSIKHEKNCGI